jgi:hypothetical protein
MEALLLDAQKGSLKLAQPIFLSLRRRALHDPAPYQCFLLRDLVFSFANFSVGGNQSVILGHAVLQSPSVRKRQPLQPVPRPAPCSCDCDAGTTEIQEQPARSDVALPNGSHISLTPIGPTPAGRQNWRKQ